MHDMGRIGLISNVHSHQNRRGMTALRAAAASQSRIAHIEIDGIDGIGEVLRDFARRDIRVVALNGGDGTVQALLSALINDAPFERPPRLAILPGGMTNLIAHDIGLKGGRERSLERLVQAVKDGHGGTEMVRHVLSMRLDPAEAPIHGLFFGTAAFYRAVMFSRRTIQPAGLDRSAAFASSLALIVLRALFGRAGADDLFRGERFSIALDGTDHGPAKDHLIFLATTLSRLPFGLMPFWGEGPGRCRYTHIESPPPRLRAALLPVLRGRPRPWMAANGYRSGRAEEIALRVTSPIVLDGQIFTPRPDHPVTLRADHEVLFLRC